jgi:hypothetical protein
MMNLCMRNQARWAIVALASVALGAASTAHAVRKDHPLDSGIREYTSAEVVRLPLVVQAASDEEKRRCATRENVLVMEDNEEMQVLEVVPEKLPTLHVIVIDTSRSMTVKLLGSPARITPALLAAKKYIEWLLPEDGGPAPEFLEDAAMIATFDDDLIVLAPPTPLARTTAKAELLDAIDRANGQLSTALAETLIHLSANLPALRYRSAVILLSDGADKAGDARYAEVLQVVNRTNNLTIFPIGLGLLDKEKASRDAEPGEHKKFLKELADATGGSYFDIIWIKKLASYPEPLIKAFNGIKDRLRQEYTLAYASKAFGSGLDDDKKAAGKDYVIRSIDIRARDRSCKIRGYKPVRYVSRNSLVSIAGPQEGGEGTAAPVEKALKSPGSIDLQLVDIEWDGDPLWYEVPQEEGERLRASLRDATYERRRVEILLPPVESPFERPEGIFHHLLSESTSINQVDYWFRRRSIHGKTLLEQRPRLAWAIYGGSPAYRAWANERMRKSIAADLMKRLPPAVRTDPEALAMVVEARMASPKDEDVTKHLAAWRGDLTAKELAAGLERDEINRLLSASEERLPEVLSVIDRVQANWGLLSYWFRPPHKWRIVAPLVPTYDASEESFGFYRIVMPRLDIEFGEGPKPDRKAVTVRDRVAGWPVALQLARWLLALPTTPAAGEVEPSEARRELADELRRRWRVISVEYDDPPPDEEPSAIYNITLELEMLGSDVRTTLHARIMRSGMAILDPLCIDEEATGDGRSLSRLVGTLGLAGCSD